MEKEVSGGGGGASSSQETKRSKGSQVSSAKKRSEVVSMNRRSQERGRIGGDPDEIPQEDEKVKRIRRIRHYRPGEEEEEEERRIGVSTKLTLFTYPWKITKKLTPSDLNNLSRLLVPTSLAEKYVMPLLDDASRYEVGTDAGLPVTVWDFDTHSSHRLLFKKWFTSNSYVLIDNWGKDFVRRRQLAADDEIGMYWDAFYCRFHFCVLSRADAAAAAAPHHHQMQQQGP